jgi:phosphoenolpyruvate carboxykinase (GTP)
MSDYFAHWLALGQRLAASGATLPRVYCVNWFRKGADGKFVWPGYGENMRVLAWMMGRVEGGAGGQDHVFGISPRFADLHWDGLDFTVEQFDSVIGVDDRLPPALDATRERLQQRLAR